MSYIGKNPVAAAPAMPSKKTRTGKGRMERVKRKSRAMGMLDGVLAMLRPGDLAIDCGANVGEITLQLAATGADVVAFEPDPVAYAVLAERVADLPNVTLLHKAVGVSAGTARLSRSESFSDDPVAATVSSTILTGARDSGAADGIDVEVIDLAAYLQERLAQDDRLALLKLDVEGVELDLLPHLADTGVLDQIGCALVETHQRKFPDKRRAFMDMRNKIAGRYPAHKVNLDWI